MCQPYVLRTSCRTVVQQAVDDYLVPRTPYCCCCVLLHDISCAVYHMTYQVPNTVDFTKYGVHINNEVNGTKYFV